MNSRSLIIRISFITILIFGLLNTLYFSNSTQRYNLISFDFIIYLYFLLIVLRSVLTRKIYSKNMKYIIFFLFYLSLQAILFSAGADAPWLEFFVAYKWLFLVVLLFCIKSSKDPFFTVSDLKFIILVFLFKYMFDNMFAGIWRPGLFGENNFEQPFVILLILYIYLWYGHLTPREKISGVILLSIGGSKSTILGVAGGLLAYFRLTRTSILLMCILVPIFVVIIFITVFQKLDFANIDRVRFMLLAVREVSDNSLLEILFGTWPLRPLSTNTCQSLAFYKELFTSVDENLCYSRVLHGFILRILHDHGVVSLFIFPLLYRMIRRLGVSRPDGLFIIALILANSLSVSGLNNHFILLALAIILQGGILRAR